MDELQLWFGQQQIEEAARALRKHDFNVITVLTRDEARTAVLEMIPLSAVVGIPGSVSVRDLGLPEALASRGNKVIQHWISGISPAEDLALRRQELTADVFLTSTNALTLDGCLVNIDGNGNRVGAMLFGPPRVIVVAGANKVVRDIPAAIHRAKNVAATMNARRMGSKTPCAALGHCTDCDSPGKICSVTTIIERRPGKTLFDIILMAEHAGF